MLFFFFFNDTATTEIYTLSLHDALPIFGRPVQIKLTSTDVIHSFWVPNLSGKKDAIPGKETTLMLNADREGRSEEHTSELQSRQYLVCRLLLEKKKKPQLNITEKVTSTT